jgi:phosphatidylserine decarboxylase
VFYRPGLFSSAFDFEFRRAILLFPQNPVSFLFMFARDGIPFIIVPVVIAIGFAFFALWVVAVFFLAFAGFMAFFFRDPRRVPPTEAGVIVSAADGTVTRIEEGDSGKLVSIFLSPLNVHINRSPIGGRVEKLEYTRGKKFPATKNEASFLNERNSLTIANDDMTVVCTQIAGILARRIHDRRTVWPYKVWLTDRRTNARRCGSDG